MNSFTGWKPMKMNTPCVVCSVTSPVLRLRSTALFTSPLPLISSTTVSQTNSIFGLSNARCCRILLARSWSLRCMTVTLFVMRVRYSPSSIAASPPPTTVTSMPRKKLPSHVAQ